MNSEDREEISVNDKSRPTEGVLSLLPSQPTDDLFYMDNTGCEEVSYTCYNYCSVEFIAVLRMCLYYYS